MLVVAFASYVYVRNLPVPVDTVALVFPFDGTHGKFSDIPDEIRALDGKYVAVIGDMYPMDRAEKFTTFAVIPPPHILYADTYAPPNIQQVVVANYPPASD